MEELMIWLIQASIRVSLTILTVLLIRILFKKLAVAKKYTCLLWLIPYIGLILPWQIESPFSIWGIFPGFTDIVSVANLEEENRILRIADFINNETVFEKNEHENIAVNNDVVVAPGRNNPENSVHNSNDTSVTNDRGQSSLLSAVEHILYLSEFLQIFACVWAAGVAGLLLYVGISVYRLRRRTLCCVKTEKGIYCGDDISTPFVFGVFRPVIYLPSDMEETAREYVIEHERTHILRKDSLKKIAAFFITILHWFNPLVWLAFCMLEKDIEMACDEETVQRMGEEKKAEYATTLLQLSAGKNHFNPIGVPLAFGESSTGSRIKNVLKYKKTVGTVAVVAVILVLVLAGLFLTRPEEKESLDTDAAVTDIGQEGIVATEDADITADDTVAADTITAEAETDTESTPVEIPFNDDWEFTMEKLIQLCEEGSDALAEHMNGFGRGDGIPYTNFEKYDAEYSLTWSYNCPLSYNGKDYRLQIVYWKEGTEEYGYAPNELDSVIINNNTSGDAQLLYSTDTRYTSNIDVRSFIEKEYDLADYLTIDLLEGMSLGAYQIGMNDNWEGCLFKGDYIEMPHGDGAPAAWYAPGGIGICPFNTSHTYGNFSAEFTNGILNKVDWSNNHSGRTSEFEPLNNCEMQAVLCEYSFDIFTLPEAEEYRQTYGLTEEELQTVSKYWYVFFAETDSAYSYVLFLNQEYFTKEDIIYLAESIQFFP